MLGAIFMATDYVTSPMSKSGMIVYGVGIGILTTVIRLFGSYPEGMSFAIFIMNGVTPLINSYMKPKHFGGKSTLPNMFLSLTIICVVAGAILAGVNMYTTGPIAATKAAALEAAIKAVTPAFDNKPTEDAYMAVTTDGDSLKIYPAMKDGKLVGAAVESNTQKGFSGEIKVIVGFDAEGKLLNYSVLQHAETPGLGAKMQEWFREDKNQQSVLGRNLADGELKVSKDGGDIDAITAATITSRAFLNAVNRAYSAFSGADGLTGATTSSDNTTKEGGNDNE